MLSQPVEGDRGPVIVTVEYRTTKETREALLRLLDRLGGERRRDGASLWAVSEDAADPHRIVEWFVVESWSEHLRQHRRVSQADAALQSEIAALLPDGQTPQVRHLLTVERPIGETIAGDDAPKRREE